MMENNLYVKYLNQPKRAKYNADSEVVLQQILQAAIWNNCLCFQQNESKPLSRKYFLRAEKSNLHDEMKLDLQKSCPNCENPCVHHYYKNRLNWLDAILKQKDQMLEKYFLAYRYNQIHSCELSNGFISNHFHNSLAHIYSDNNLPHCSTNNFSKNSVKRKVKMKHCYRFSPYSAHLQRGISFKNTATWCSNDFPSRKAPSNFFDWDKALKLSSETCVVDANHLCSCENTPSPSLSCLYHHDCTSFYVKKSLALYLLLTSSTNTRNNNDITVMSALKKMIESWCQHMKVDSNISCKCIVHKQSLATESSSYHYSYYSTDGKAESNLDSDEALFLLLKSQLSNEDAMEFDSVYEDELDSNKENRNGAISKLFNSLIDKYCCHPICFSDCTLKKSITSSNNFSSVKRISSRLQKKRDSGVQSPFSSDFIVEVPVAKKVKKTKSSHPYSHQLFWNFYEQIKMSECRQWNALARTYFELCIPGDPKEQKTESAHLPHSVLAKDNAERLDALFSCSLCGISFKHMDVRERRFHINRHSRSQWKPFQIPQFNLNRWPPKPSKSLTEEKAPAKVSVVEVPKNNAPEKETVRKRPTFNCHTRPTARKSHGCW